jgi:hypothetical protein
MTTLVSVTMSGPGTWTYDDTATAVAIGYVETAINNSTGVLSKEIVGTAGNSLNRIANAIVGTGNQQVNVIGKLTSIESAINSLSITLKTTNSILGQAVAVQTLAVAEQIKNNKFTQTATNAALTRSKLPPVVVQPADAQQAIAESITSAGTVSAQAAATGFVTNTIAQAGTFMVQVSGIEAAFETGSNFVGGKIKEGFKAIGLSPVDKKAAAEQKETEALCKRI